MEVSNFKLGVGIPLSFPMVDADFFESYVNMEKPPYINIRASNGGVTEMRNGIVKIAQQAGCSHLVMFDADMIYKRDTLTNLLKHKDNMVVGALCFKKFPPFNPVFIREGDNAFEWEENSLIEVDRTGTGCMLINMQVFNDIEKPYFENKYDESGIVLIGEDYLFCDKVKEAGHKIYVDTATEVDHLTKLRSNEKLWRAWDLIKKRSKTTTD